MAANEGAARYHRIQLVLGIVDLALSVLFLVVILLLGVGPGLVALAERVSEARWWQVTVVTVALGLAHGLLGFPLAWVRGYWRHPFMRDTWVYTGVGEETRR